MAKNQKLELTWIGKDQRPRLEPRILLEDPELSHHAEKRVTSNDFFDNRLIFGDNLLALKALEQEFTGKVKCVYIDPPFNTQQAFEHYDDGVEHSVWLSLMRDRLTLLHKLLRSDGTMAVHIDDNELGYLIVLLDEIFGRQNRTYVVTFKQSSSSGPKAVNPGLVTTSSYVLFYARNKASWSPKKIFAATARDDRYNKVIANISDENTQWRLVNLREAVATEDGIELVQLKKRYATKDELEARLVEFVTKHSDSVVRTARVAASDIAESARPAFAESQRNKARVYKGDRDGKSPLYFLGGEQLIFYSAKLREIDGELATSEAATTIWDDLLSNNLHKEGGVAFPNGKKPEALIKRILEMSTDEGDWVLDSFAGSGTTPATAHKMRRRWIAVELGEHCHTHVLPRLRSVVDGTDDSGVTKATRWKSGGGFRFFRLAPSLIENDRWGNPIISNAYNADMLAEAICKLEGFAYAPTDVYWQHGLSTEHDFIYVTTQKLTRDQLQALSDDVGEDRTLLVCCSAFRAKVDSFRNLTIKKIPHAVLSKCEWGHDDYSLQIKNLPAAPDLGVDGDFLTTQKKGKAKKPAADTMSLFDTTPKK
jgi:adenine-specific DNA-methyltransferase